MTDAGNATPTDPMRLDYESYLDFRGKLTDIERDVTKRFDQAVVLVAAGAFGLTLTFLRDVARTPREPQMLLAAWLLFGLSVSVSLASHLVSQRSCRVEMGILDREQTDGCDAGPNPRNRASMLTEWFNAATLFVLFVGLVLVAVFAYANMG